MGLPRPCRICGAPTRETGGRCKGCTPTTAQRGYDHTHRTRADELRTLGLPCSLCAQPIDYTLHAPHPGSFVAHHTTRDKKNGPLAPAHRLCNERAGQPTT